ncbi:oxygenase MpaB family protein [Caulobacter sp. 73W]|uniref:Oxygenase MpaB family protein n=1 Tax=Caulobacter sp. 73W TaxID=3161137 RepID=A0AB39KWU9_9CAUL
MIRSIEEVRSRVAAQKTLLPAFYGAVDFDHTPERFTDDARAAVVTDRAPMGVRVTQDDLDRVRAYTMLGDHVADAYAALIPDYGFRRLIAMLTQACEQGVDAVKDAPPQLRAFIADMEDTPDWVDMDLVRRGARLDRNATAHLAPFAIRGAFMATFLNKYAALPMALTGTLSNDTAAKRVNETATFFTTTVLPGALERHGEGFKAAAMVRLMHSMVRFNALRSGQWDTKIYGVPIPQVDQMPAGLIPIFLMAFAMIRKGRTSFTRDERAKVELARYRCFLLGLPQDLLADTPEGIVRIMTARNSTLRRGFDDATSGALIRATLDAYLPPDRSPTNRLHDRLERRFARTFFLRHFMEGDRLKAREMGIEVSRLDEVVFVACGLLVYGRLAAFRIAGKVPGLRDVTDAILVRRIRQLLVRYGHAEYTTDAARYRSAARASVGSA